MTKKTIGLCTYKRHHVLPMVQDDTGSAHSLDHSWTNLSIQFGGVELTMRLEKPIV